MLYGLLHISAGALRFSGPGHWPSKLCQTTNVIYVPVSRELLWISATGWPVLLGGNAGTANSESFVLYATFRFQHTTFAFELVISLKRVMWDIQVGHSLCLRVPSYFAFEFNRVFGNYLEQVSKEGNRWIIVMRQYWHSDPSYLLFWSAVLCQNHGICLPCVILLDWVPPYRTCVVWPLIGLRCWSLRPASRN